MKKNRPVATNTRSPGSRFLTLNNLRNYWIFLDFFNLKITRISHIILKGMYMYYVRN